MDEQIRLVLSIRPTTSTLDIYTLMGNECTQYLFLCRVVEFAQQGTSSVKRKNTFCFSAHFIWCCRRGLRARCLGGRVLHCSTSPVNTAPEYVPPRCVLLLLLFWRSCARDVREESRHPVAPAHRIMYINTTTYCCLLPGLPRRSPLSRDTLEVTGRTWRRG